MIIDRIVTSGSKPATHRRICNIRRVDAARPSRSGVLLFPPLRAATLLLLFASPAMAGDGGGTPPPLLDNWLANLAYVMGLVYMAARVWQMRQPNPPNHRQFSPIDHRHADVITKPEQETCRAEHTRELMTIRQEMGGFTGKMERQLDHLRNLIGTQNAQMMAEINKMDDKNEKRILHLHERLDPLPAAIAVNTRSIETHLADHRAGKAP
jgi:hypothetical protein